MEVVALGVALIVLMVNTNIQILEISVHIVAQVLLVAVLLVHLESISTNQGKGSVVIVDLIHMVVVHIVHLENMNIK